MSTFTRYFIHFFSISMFIFIMLLILGYIDNTLDITPIIVLIGFLCVQIFSIPMALFFNGQAKQVQVSIVNERQYNTMEKLDTLIQTKFSRTNKEVEDNRIIYKMNGKYNQWLTNPVKVVENKESIIVILPKSYKQELMSRFIEYK